MAEPVEAAGAHDASRRPSPKPRVGVPGAEGTASGRTFADGGDGRDQSTALRAATVNVYSTSLVRPSTVHVVDAHSRTRPPGWAVTRYPVIGSPLFAGASQARTTARSR